MKFLIVLLLASLAYASPVPTESQDKIQLEAHHADAVTAAQLTSSRHPSEHRRKDQVSNEELFMDSTISKEETISADDAVIRSIQKVKDSRAQLLDSIAQKVFSKVDLLLEENKEHTPEMETATISERKLVDFIQKIKEDLKEALKNYIDIVNKFFPPTPKDTKP